jgi:2,4-dienoyl-CoA reductase-like NADH-dependent reductase (Old Yellow Enzyme family)
MDMFKPCLIGKLELKNRFVRSATCESTGDDAGKVTDASINFHRKLSRGGVGIIVTGLTYVSEAGKSFPGQFGIHSDNMIPGLKRLVQAVHSDGAKIAVQLVYGGTPQFGDVTPSTVAKSSRTVRPLPEMTGAEIETIINDFTLGVERARLAGFDAVQLHGAHSYLMCQFLSPLSNHRTDRWGGSLDNRRRFHLEVIRRIREKVGKDYPLWIKFGIQDEEEGGLTLEQGIETARLMVNEGIDVIEVSAGMSALGAKAANPTRKRNEPEIAYFRGRAHDLKQSVNLPVILVGGIRSLALAQEIVDSGDADLISMCRPFIREPDLIKKWQDRVSVKAACISCDTCAHVTGAGLVCGQIKKGLEFPA